MNPIQSYQKNKLLSEASTFGIGGPAKYFLEARSVFDLQAAFRWCKEHKVPYLIIGKGSNCLFDDRGFDGLLIINKIDSLENPSEGTFKAGAGYSFSLLGVQTARKGWAGLEFASGIPASVGGAVFMNAGANGSETCQTLESVDYVDPDGFVHNYTKDQLHFAYRTSSFQKWPGAIASATFCLTPCSEARQKQIEIVKYRQKTQPYGDKSAGCIFRNPVCNFAGKLIEEAGLKGTKIGGAQVSEMHANFIVNAGGAKASDVLNLIEHIKENVHRFSGIELESEVRIIPYRTEL